MNQIVDLSIKSINKEGFGKAVWTRPDGTTRDVVVPYSLPGEEVSACVLRSRRMPAKIESIIKTSPDRVTPCCRHFGACGGCRLQHMSDQAQSAFKKRAIDTLFASYTSCIRPLISSPHTYMYRNKMEWSFSQDAKGQKFLGLILQGTRGRVENILECHLVDPWMTTGLKAIRAFWAASSLLAYNHNTNTGHLRTLAFRDSRRTGDRVIILTVSANPDYPVKRHDLDAFVQVCKGLQGSGTLTVILRIHQIVKGSPSQMYEMRLFGPDVFREEFSVGGKVTEFHVSPSSFLQPNAFTASVIYNTALDLADLNESDVLYDLYAGIGVFGMCVAHRVKHVVSIELNPDSAYDAKCNRDRLKLANVELFEGDVGAVLESKTIEPATCVFVDPPRTGLGKKVCAEIAAIGPKKLVYVSCNPVTQAEDVKELVALGFEVDAIQPIDQFPQTVHVENIVCLKQKI